MSMPGRQTCSLRIPKALASVCGQIPQLELLKYKEIRNAFTFDKHFSPFAFWQTYARVMPQLSAAALQALAFPSSIAQVERSFSLLRRVLTPVRSHMSEENLAVHFKMAFNKEICAPDAVEYVDEDEEDDDEDF